MLVTMIIGLFALTAGTVDPLFFDANDTGPPPVDVPAVRPWRIVPLDPDYGGQWVVAADLDADGEVEFVACENYDAVDVHYTSTAVAHDLDGTVLWRWGDPDIGRKQWHRYACSPTGYEQGRTKPPCRRFHRGWRCRRHPRHNDRPLCFPEQERRQTGAPHRLGN